MMPECDKCGLRPGEGGIMYCDECFSEERVRREEAEDLLKSSKGDTLIQAQIISDNEQDRAAAEQWWREATRADKLKVWLRIQIHVDDPVGEIVSRFAQLAYGEMMEKFGP